MITIKKKTSLRLDNADAVLKPYEFKMQEIEGFRYRCRVSVPQSQQQQQQLVLFPVNPLRCWRAPLFSQWVAKVCSFCFSRFRAGCHALRDQAGRERGPTERDQAGAAQLRKAQGELQLPGRGRELVHTSGIGCFSFGVWFFFLPRLRPISRTTREICSCSDTTKTSILLWSNPTWRTCPITSVRNTHTHTHRLLIGSLSSLTRSFVWPLQFLIP